MMSESIYKVGITGGIGVGKTTIAKVFQLLSIALYNADERAKLLVIENIILKNSIIQLLGNHAYEADGSYNRAFVAQKVFLEPLLLQQLNNLIHPAVASDFEAWCKRQSSPYILKEAALLVESGSYKALDKLVVVTAPLAIRVARVQHRDQRSLEEIQRIIDRQLTDEEKIAKADFIISNDDQSLVIPQVLAIDKQLGLFANGRK